MKSMNSGRQLMLKPNQSSKIDKSHICARHVHLGSQQWGGVIQAMQSESCCAAGGTVTSNFFLSGRSTDSALFVHLSMLDHVGDDFPFQPAPAGLE